MIGNRRSIRLAGYDYSSPGAYFITACTQGHQPLFGRIHGEAMQLNDAGRIVQATWEALPQHYAHIVLDAWVVMPNHVHMIVVIQSGTDDVWAGGVGAGFKPAQTGLEPPRTGPPRAGLEPPQTGLEPPRTGPPRTGPPRAGLKPAPTVPEIVRALKTFSARRINELRGTPGIPVWQRNYYEHIIRDERSWDRIRQYIVNNPANWANDVENRSDGVETAVDEILRLLREMTA